MSSVDVLNQVIYTLCWPQMMLNVLIVLVEPVLFFSVMLGVISDLQR